MSVIQHAIETGVGICIADPKPAYCSNCHNHDLDSKFVSFPAAHDAGSFVNPPIGEYVAGSDDLYLCEACVRTAAEVLDYKAQLHGRQRREIRRLELLAEHWRDYAKTIEQTLRGRPEDDQ